MKIENFSIMGLGALLGIIAVLGLSSLPGGIKHFQLMHAAMQAACEKSLPRNEQCVAVYVPASTKATP